jgi:hypothetical protein
VWITSRDLRNANLKIILAYIIMGHPDWKGSEITLFVALGAENQEGEVVRLNDLIANGRIPISRNNVVQINNPERLPFDKVVSRHSVDADLVITGFSLARLKKDRGAFFKKFEGIADILFVRAGQDILITDGTAASPELRDDGLDPVVEVFEGEESGDLEESTG